MNVATQFDGDDHAPAIARPAFMHAGTDPFHELVDEFGDLKEVLNDIECLSGAETARELDKMRKGIDRFTQEITFIGQIKAGKTMLVNAMAGRPGLLPSDVNPWTSVVTSLHMDTQRSTDGGAEFRFFEADEWDRLMSGAGRLGEVSERIGAEDEYARLVEQTAEMREMSKARLGRSFERLLGQKHSFEHFDTDVIRRYVCLGDAVAADDARNRQGQYADITKSADIYLPMDVLPYSLVLRDTPGLNDTFLMREQVTIRAIRDSRICVVVLSAQQALNTVDLGLIRLISSIKSRQVVLFVNRIDELSEPARELPRIKQSLLRTLADSNGPENPRIIFGSALWATAALDGSTDTLPGPSLLTLRDYLDDPTDADISPQDCWAASGVPELYACIGRRIQSGPGQKAISSIRKRATNMVLGLQASTQVAGLTAKSDQILKLTDDRVASRIAQVEATAQTALDAALTRTFDGFGSRIDRAHINFLNRAVEALLQHLDSYGEHEAWNYSPDGLRLLARSAYSAMSVSLKREVTDVFTKVSADLTAAYGDIFDVDAGHFKIEAPEIPDLPPPVTIAKTIILDISTPWWKTWSRKRRGYSVLSSDFRALIEGETDSILKDLKIVQLAEIREIMQGTLREFLAEQNSILADILARSNVGVDDLNTLYGLNQQAERSDMLNILLNELDAPADASADEELQDGNQ